jgi:hypothetical protein
MLASICGHFDNRLIPCLLLSFVAWELLSPDAPLLASMAPYSDHRTSDLTRHFQLWFSTSIKIAFHFFQVIIQSFDTSRHTPADVIVLFYVRNILTRLEVMPLSAILDQFSTTATVRLRVPNWGHANSLNLFFNAHIFMAGYFALI